MPKVTIHDGPIRELITVPKSDTHPEYLQYKDWDGAITENPLRRDPSLALVWGDEYVQFGMKISRHQFEELAAELERMPELEDMTVYTGPVSRRDMNEAIKSIRRARDKVWEPDA